MGARRIFREGIRVFCLEASLGDYFVSPGQRCLWAAVRRISLATFLVSILRPESSAAQEVPERLYQWDSSVWSGARGPRQSRPRLEFWGSPADADRYRNTLSPCALGSEEASLAAAHLVRRPDGHRDGVPRHAADDRHGH